MVGLASSDMHVVSGTIAMIMFGYVEIKVTLGFVMANDNVWSFVMKSLKVVTSFTKYGTK